MQTHTLIQIQTHTCPSNMNFRKHSLSLQCVMCFDFFFDLFYSSFVFKFWEQTTKSCWCPAHGAQPGVCKDLVLESQFLVWSVGYAVVLSQHVLWKEWRGSVGLASGWSGDWLGKFLVYMETLCNCIRSSASVRVEGRLGFPLNQGSLVVVLNPHARSPSGPR